MPERIDPAITEQDVARMTDLGSFRRGKSYFRSQAIINPVREGNTLIAECVGSDVEPYRVRITLGEKGIVDFDCSCPRGGFCKHVVALALTYIHQPEQFVEQEPLEELLARLSREQLVALVKIMVERYPSLRALIPVQTQESSASSERLSTTPFRQQVRTAVKQDVGYMERGYYGRGSALQTVYRALHSQAQHYAEKGDWANAGVIYQAIIEELCQAYRSLWEYDESDEAGSELLAAVARLITCFEHLPDDDPLRQQWIQTLWDFLVTDMENGGYADTSNAELTLIENTTAEEWQSIELCEQLGTWQEERESVLHALREQGKFAALTEIAVEEGDARRALEMLKMFEAQRESDRMLYYSYYSYQPLRLRVAEVAEKDYPEEAIRLYKREAEALIARRGRTYYAEAAALLTRVRHLYSRQGQEEEWQKYIARLREEHYRLPALQDELNKAGL